MASVFRRLHSIYFDTHGYIEWSSEDLQNIEELNAIEPGITYVLKTDVEHKVPGVAPTLAIGGFKNGYFNIRVSVGMRFGRPLSYHWTLKQLTAFLNLMEQKGIEPC